MTTPQLPRWHIAPIRPLQPDGRGKRLVIVVPYRNREANLVELLPLLKDYFIKQGEPRLWPLPKICIVEQSDALPFKKGALCNVGFALHREELDYVCFHDADCAPEDVDYSYTDIPARLIETGTRNPENLNVFFGAVVALSKTDFEAVNGYSNQYLVWGFEDSDMLLRIVRSGRPLEARAGKFRALPHVPAERDDHGGVHPEVFANRQRFHARVERSNEFWRDDGLSTLRYTLINSVQHTPAHDDALEIVHHRVQFPPLPTL